MNITVNQRVEPIPDPCDPPCNWVHNAPVPGTLKAHWGRWRIPVWVALKFLRWRL